MTGKKYKQLRKNLNHSIKLEKQNDKYVFLKMILIDNVCKFSSNNNLFNLVEIIKTGNKILKLENFPTKQYEKNKKK